MELSGKAIAITGAYSGLGLALAEKLASKKAKLVVSGRDEAKLMEAADRLRRQTEVIAVKADVTKVRDCKKIVDSCVGSFGRMDVMVNNAGVLEDGLKAKLIDKLVDVNLKGTEYCSYYALSHMKKQAEGGVLVNISSTSGVFVKPKESEAIYISSKFGVTAFSAALHLAHKDSKIKIMCFCPGGMKTNLFRKDLERILPDFMSPRAAAGVLIKQLVADKFGLLVLLRKGLLQYSKDFSLSWQWTEEENIDMLKEEQD